MVVRSTSPHVRLLVAALAFSFVLAIVLAATGVVTPRGSGIALGASSTVTILSGDVLVRHARGDFASIVDGDVVGPGDVVRTQDGARAVVTYFEGSTVEIEPGSELAVDEASSRPDGSTVILMTQNVGRTWHLVTHLLTGGSRYDVRTPNTTASVRGTAFQVEVAGEQTVVTTTEGRVAASDVAGTAEVVVVPGFTTAIKRDQRPEEPKPAPEPERKVTVNVGAATGSLVVDPLGRANGIKDGKIVIQTPGAQVTTVNGQLVITLPNIPDGKLATVVEKKDRPRGSTVDVTTTVQERGREPVKVEDRVRIGDEARTVTGVEVHEGAGAAPTIIRTVEEIEKKDLPKEKVLATPKPDRAAPIFRPAAPAEATPAEKRRDESSAEPKKPEQPAAENQAETPAPRQPPSGFVPVLPLFPVPPSTAPVTPPPARPAAPAPTVTPARTDNRRTPEPTREPAETTAPTTEPGRSAGTAAPATARPTDDDRRTPAPPSPSTPAPPAPAAPAPVVSTPAPVQPTAKPTEAPTAAPTAKPTDDDKKDGGR